MSTEPDIRLQIPPVAWGRLAAVVRTVEWASAHPDRLSLTAHLGANCGRLMDQALSAMAVPPALEPPLLRARALLAGFDARSLREQHSALRSLRQELQTVIPLSQIGAPVLPLPPQGLLLAPDQPDPPASAGTGVASPSISAEPALSDSDDGIIAAVVVVDPAGSESLEPERWVAVPGAGEPELRSGEGEGPSGEAVLDGGGEPGSPRLPLGHPDGTGALVLTLSGVDASLAERLEAVGVQTIAQLLAVPPATVERVTSATITAQMEEGVFMVRGAVRSRCLRLSPLGRRWEVVLEEGDPAERLICRWMGHAPRGWLSWERGAAIALVGGVEHTEDSPVMYEAEPLGLDGRGAGLLPVYGLPGIEDVQIRELMAEALEGLSDRLLDPLPATVLERYRLAPLEEALRDAHFPSNVLGRGRQRLAFEELLLLQLGVVWRAGRGQAERGVSHTIVHNGIAQIGAQHNLLLDNGQEAAFSDIRRDLARGEPMTRLLQGDVGTGQELVALLTAAMVAESRTQVAMVGPDPLAVERRYLFAEGILRTVGIVPLLVGEPLSHAQADAIRRGEAHIVFGTRRILANDVHWRRLGLVVVEERAEYGTVSPGVLALGKGPRPDLLVTTAAPIPTALTFTVFGDFDVSFLPGTRQIQIEERVYDAGQRASAYAAVMEQLQQGRQAFVVLPVRDGRDLLNTEDALRMAKALQAEAFPGKRIGVYCSAMSREERLRAFEDFQHRRLDVLVCTTYIEDAPLLDNATVMVVEYADLHDMVRLHRLRGHVGRGPRLGVAHYILSNAPAEGARATIEQVTREHDGFRIADMDLASRGSAALLGERAEDVPELGWAELNRDRRTMIRARTEAIALLRESNHLRRWPELVAAIHARWGDWFGDSLPSPEGRRSGSASRRRRRRRKS